MGVVSAIARARRSMTASNATLSLNDRGTLGLKVTQLPWQREVYRLLEVVAELRYAANLIGVNVAAARLYIADVDSKGETIGETKNAKAKAIASTIFGNQDRRREEMRLLGFNLFVAGEALIFGRAGDSNRKDEWYAISVNDIRRKDGKLVVNIGDGDIVIRPEVDILRRIWTPDPNRRCKADSAPRSCRLVLRELEILTNYVLSQGNSRLTGAGILTMPAGSTPAGKEGTAAEDLTARLAQVVALASRQDGSPDATIPIIMELAPDAMGKVQHINFASELSKEAANLRGEAVRRLALGLDMPPEQLLGMGENTNHWGSWHIEESGVKTHIEPLLSRICFGLWEAWTEPALQLAGLNPDRFRLCYDTAPLTVRPQRLKDTLDLYTAGLVGAQAVLEAGAYLLGDAPSEEEDIRRFMRDLVLRDPELFNQSAVRELVGVTTEMMPAGPSAETGQLMLTDSGTPPPPPPAPAQVPGKHVPPAIPDASKSKAAGGPQAVTASGAPDTDLSDTAILALAETMALRTLELAGKRLLTNHNRAQVRGIPSFQIHTIIEFNEAKIGKMMEGGGEHFAMISQRYGAPDTLPAAVGAYCATTLRSRQPHDPNRLRSQLTTMGVLGAGR